MLPLLAELTADPATVMLLADSDSGVAGIALPFLAGPAVFAAVYGGIYRYYRNTDKSHEFERDTIIDAQPVGGGESKVDHISRTRDSDIKGDNSDDYRKRVQRVG